MGFFSKLFGNKKVDRTIDLNALTDAAKRGDAEAQYQIGLIYIQGTKPEDYKASLEILESAANQGHVKAQLRLGTAHLKNHGISQEVALAEKWFLLAAKQGNAVGQQMLGTMYASMLRGANGNVEDGYRWMQLAAAQGNTRAKELLQTHPAFLLAGLIDG